MAKGYVVDLWCGTKSATEIWKENGFIVISVDSNPDFEPTICKDILDVTAQEIREAVGRVNGSGEYTNPTFVWASPQCTWYSLTNMRWNTHFDPETKEALTESAVMINARVMHTLKIIQELDPVYWVLENPRALLRTMNFMKPYPRATVSYCQYGHDRMKPTDLWGRFPITWNPLLCSLGAPCHVAAPRGSKEGANSPNVKDRVKAAMIPYGLTESIYNSSLESRGEAWKTLRDY